jgi:hypothetical protein
MRGKTVGAWVFGQWAGFGTEAGSAVGWRWSALSFGHVHSEAFGDASGIVALTTRTADRPTAAVPHDQDYCSRQDTFGRKEVTVGVVGNNLLNEDIRNHVSYTKDQVLMPGAGVRVFANVKY